MEWQVALLALVIVVIVVVLLYCFLTYCAKERSFDDLIKENSGISVLLGEDAKKAAAKREKLKTSKKAVTVKSSVEEKHHEKQTAKVPTISVVESSTVEEETVSQPTETAADGNQLIRRKRNKKGKERLSQGESTNAVEDVVVANVVETYPTNTETTVKVETVGVTMTSGPVEQETKKKAKKDKKKLKAEKSGDSTGDDKTDSTRQQAAPLASVENVNLSEGDFNDVLVDQLATTTLSKRQVELLLEALQSKYSKHVEWYQTHQKNEQVSVLKRQLAEKEQQLLGEASVLQSLKKQLSDARGELDTEKGQHITLEKSVQNLTSQRQALEQRQMELTRSYNQSIQQMQASLTQYQKICEHQQQIENENKHLKECCARQEAEKVRVAAQLQQAQMDMSAHDQKLRSTEQDLIRYRDRCNELETKSVHVHMQDGAVTHQLSETTRMLHEKEALLKKAQDECVTLRKDLESLNVQLLKNVDADKALKENGEVSHELDRLRKENEGNVRKLKEAKTATTSYMEKISALETESTSAKHLADQLRQSVTHLNTELAEFAAMKTSAAHLQQELNRLKTERDQLEETVAQQEFAIRSSSESTVVIDQRSKVLESQLDKLRLEYEVERNTREQLKAQLDAKTHSDEIRYKELEGALNAKNKMEAELSELKTQMEELRKRDATLHKEIDSLKHHADKITKECDSLSSSKQQLAAELAAAQQSVSKMAANQQQLEEIQVKVASQIHSSPGSESELTAALRDAKLLKEQIALLEDTIVGRDKTVTKLESELCDWQHRFKDAERSLSEARGEVTRLVDQQSETSKQLQALRNENISLLEQLRSLEEERLNTEEINREVNGHEGSGNEVEIEQLKAEVSKECGSLKQLLMQRDAEISTLKVKNNDLREKNYKVVEAIGVSEKNTNELIHKRVTEVEEKYKQLLNEQRNLTRQAMAKIAPDVAIPESSENYREWLHEIETIFKREVVHHYHKETSSSHSATHSAVEDNKIATLQKRFDVVTKEKAEVESQLTHFKFVLSQTEDMLKKLESSVEHEQTYLRQRVESLTQELSRVKLELANSLSKSSSVDTQTVREIETLKTQLVELHTRSELWEKERIHLTTVVERITSDLETERATGRDLSAQAVKLRGMLKTGQDALRQEQELVAQLQKQLQNYLSNGVSNGSSSKADSKGNQSLDDELKALRSKLGERESQLERELMTNKQLNSKLASLGVAAQHSP